MQPRRFFTRRLRETKREKQYPDGIVRLKGDYFCLPFVYFCLREDLNMLCPGGQEPIEWARELFVV